jgi:uncharacterized protein (DUF2267 family)
MVAVPILENNIHQTMDWIYAIEEACHWDENNQKKAFLALKAVLHQLRDLLPIESAAQLGDLLPIVIRGIFFENWKPTTPQVPEPKREDILKNMTSALYPYHSVDVEQTVRGVLQVLKQKLPTNELEAIIRGLPKELREFYGNIIK